jgi:undecaprenyl pyrophosphate phosphatase UppP
VQPQTATSVAVFFDLDISQAVTAIPLNTKENPMKTSIWINVAAAMVVTGLMAIDYKLVKDTEQPVILYCDTRVAYDKSGSMYCMEGVDEAVKVSQK